jgi:prevent-host-death family protein
MRAVNIADLKNNLSRYLNEVRGGEEILVRDRRTPIAKIVPLKGPADLDAETRALVAAGQMRLEVKPLDVEALLALEPSPVRITARRLAQLISKDRAERDSSVLGRQRRRTAVHS